MKNIDPNLIKAAQNSKDPKKLMDNLSPKDKETVAKMLADKDALAKLLKSPEAMAIMKLLSGKGNNG